jgi:hypothetical protein
MLQQSATMLQQSATMLPQSTNTSQQTTTMLQQTTTMLQQTTTMLQQTECTTMARWISCAAALCHAQPRMHPSTRAHEDAAASERTAPCCNAVTLLQRGNAVATR